MFRSALSTHCDGVISELLEEQLKYDPNSYEYHQLEVKIKDEEAKNGKAKTDSGGTYR